MLVSFGGYGLQGATRRAQRPATSVLWPGDVDEAAMYDAGYRYEDLVRAVDVVVTKPGYGIISECIANDTALLYTSRGDFREYPVLVEAMPKYLRCAFIEQDELLSGNWQPHLDRLLAQPAPKDTATNEWGRRLPRKQIPEQTKGGPEVPPCYEVHIVHALCTLCTG